MIRTYSELSSIKTFNERFEYLKLGGFVGEETFGFDRYINQKFYQSYEWKRVRREVIIRDNGCDLGVDGYEINKGIIIHHMNPITKDDIANITEYLLNPEYLITTMLMTHNAIHYGDVSLIQSIPIERAKNDTCPWKQ
nr:MAG TPA: HNH endonuclease bacteriophage, HNH Endonuclease, DNA.52A [Caudoviricetes sp.]